jgi:hypothetical protein
MWMAVVGRGGLVVAAIFLCASSATPYQAKGLRGGYEDQDLGGGRYLITVDVNSYTSSSEAMQYAYRRAGELCPSGYDPITGDRATDYVNIGGKTYNKGSSTLVVQCHGEEERTVSSEEQREAPKKHERRTVTGARPVFCTVSGADKDVGLCFLIESACQAVKTDGWSDCERHEVSACYNATKVLDQSRVTVCSVSIKDCEGRRTKDAADPDLKDVTAECGIYRAKASDDFGDSRQ